mgnify:CR=1 FL=1
MLKNLGTFLALVSIVTIFMYANVAKADMVTDGLVGYWSLDEETIKGDTVEDVWGENDGTIKGSPKEIGGKIGEALKFDGDDSVDIPGTQSLNFNSKKELTVTAWANVGAKEPVIGVVAGCCGTIVAQRDANSWALRYDGRNPGDDMEFIVSPGWQGDGGFGAPRFKKGEWHHLTGVVDRTKLLLYVDGELLKEMPFAGPMVSDSSEAEIGHAGDGGFVGLIDEVAIYNRALSAKEVKQNFQSKGLAVAPAGKLATRWGQIKVSR